MRISTPRAGIVALGLLAGSAAAHSWIEVAYKIDAATRKFIGAPGYPRGGSFRRLSAENGLTDQEYIHRMPENGKYTGEENINKRPIEANRPDETLQAAPGDYIAIMHLENGHVSYKQDGRPLNSGNIYIYGTSEPKDEDKLFDIHLVWNEAGTGGDGRGRLLATRNYDDGQCYEGNAASEVALERSKALNSVAQDSLACQSNIKLPDDLKPGSNYTIYWYWDWPLLNQANINMEDTKKGIFPWMGTYMQGKKDPHGLAENTLMTNESYSSTMDIMIVDKASYKNQALPEEETAQSPVYRTAIKEQMENKFDIKVPGMEGGTDNDNSDEPSAAPSSTETPSPSEATAAPTPSNPGCQGQVTVTVTTTVTPETAAASATKSTSTETVVQVQTQYTTVYADKTDAAATPMPTAEQPQANTPRMGRRSRIFGGH